MGRPTGTAARSHPSVRPGTESRTTSSWCRRSFASAGRAARAGRVPHAGRPDPPASPSRVKPAMHPAPPCRWGSGPAPVGPARFARPAPGTAGRPARGSRAWTAPGRRGAAMPGPEPCPGNAPGRSAGQPDPARRCRCVHPAGRAGSGAPSPRPVRSPPAHRRRTIAARGRGGPGHLPSAPRSPPPPAPTRGAVERASDRKSPPTSFVRAFRTHPG